MSVKRDDILNCIPQRPPIVMIDELLHADTKSTRTSFLIEPTNIFCADGKFTEPGLIENIAQTAAAGAGYALREGQADDFEVPIGYIGAIRDLKIHFLPDHNSTIETEVAVENIVMDVTMVSGKVFLKGKVAAECNMKIFIDKTGKVNS